MMYFLLLSLVYSHHARSQSFSNGFYYDHNMPSLSSSCQSALNETVQCHWMLPATDQDSLELTSENLTSICTADCSSTLKSTRASIASACPNSSNSVVVNGIAYPATETIDRLADLYSKLCLRDA